MNMQLIEFSIFYGYNNFTKYKQECIIKILCGSFS